MTITSCKKLKNIYKKSKSLNRPTGVLVKINNIATLSNCFMNHTLKSIGHFLHTSIDDPLWWTNQPYSCKKALLLKRKFDSH